MTLRLHGDARPLRADAKRWRCPSIRAGPRKGNRTIRAVPMLLDLLVTVPSYGVQAFDFSPSALLSHAAPLPHPFICMGMIHLSSPIPPSCQIACSESAQHGKIRVCHALGPIRVS